MRPVALALLALSLITLAPEAEAATATVKVLGGFFEPAGVSLAPGDSIRFISEDPTPHTVTSSWDQGTTFDIILREADSFTYTLHEAGVWSIHCRPHSGMEMTVQVTTAAAKIATVPIPALAVVIAAVLGAMLLSRRR